MSFKVIWLTVSRSTINSELISDLSLKKFSKSKASIKTHSDALAILDEVQRTHFSNCWYNISSGLSYIISIHMTRIQWVCTASIQPHVNSVVRLPYLILLCTGYRNAAVSGTHKCRLVFILSMLPEALAYEWQDCLASLW